jgi:predicted nucleic acid-binding protein
MIVVVDSNILFSSLISPNGRIASLISLPPSKVDFITCHYAIAELFKHQPKIVKYSKREPKEVAENLSTVINRLKLFNESLFETAFWKEAEVMTKEVDCFDIVRCSCSKKGCLALDG